MTDIKRYLLRIRDYDGRINAKLEELAHLKSMVTKITPTLHDDSSSGTAGSSDKLAEAVAKIVDLESEINIDIESYVNAKREISKIIDMVSDADQLQVLHKRYIQGKTLEQIACEMNMTYRNVCYINGKGLQSVNAILKKQKSCESFH